MISRSDDPYRGSNRVFRIALVISLLLHPLIFALFTDLHIDWRQHVSPEKRLQTHDEIVTISSSPKRARKTVAQAEAPHRAAKNTSQQPQRVAQVARQPQPLVRPQPQVRPALPRRAVAIPAYRTPAPIERELSKIVASGTPLPKIQPPRPETPPPAKTRLATPAPKAVAEVQRAGAATQAEPAVQPQPRSAPARYSQAQIAQIESDLAKSINQSRAQDNPLSNVSKQTVAEAPKQYTVDFQALTGNLRGAQGVCDPLKSWTQDGWDYYWAACNVVEGDGSTHRKPMPWPVRWRPRSDPWSGANNVTMQGPMPGPPPGWHPDPAHPLDPDFAGYLKRVGYAL